MFVDSHCHLNYKGLIEDQQGVLERARAAGVSMMLNISTRASEWDAVIGTAERECDVMASVGIHPHEADVHPDVETETLVETAKHPKVIGIGESGLDYYYDRSDRARQRQSFRSHIAAARETQLPLIVHTRDAEEDTYAILAEEMEQGPLSGADPLLHRRPGLRRQGAGARPLHLDLGDRDLQECQGAAGGREDDPARSAADRDRFALPRSGAASRQALRAGLCRRYRALPRRAQGRAARDPGKRHRRQLPRDFSPRPAA